jgi:hypothetical protein
MSPSSFCERCAIRSMYRFASNLDQMEDWLDEIPRGWTESIHFCFVLVPLLVLLVNILPLGLWLRSRGYYKSTMELRTGITVSYVGWGEFCVLPSGQWIHRTALCDDLAPIWIISKREKINWRQEGF